MFMRIILDPKRLASTSNPTPALCLCIIYSQGRSVGGRGEPSTCLLFVTSSRSITTNYRLSLEMNFVASKPRVDL